MFKMCEKLILWLVLTLCLSDHFVNSDSTWWQKHAAKFTCERPGYFTNPADCHNFYRCVDRSTWNKPALQRYDFTCPNGMVFDQSVSVCTHPGPNGCADPWWPENNVGGNGGGRPNNIPESPNEENSVDSLPPIFQSSKGPGGRRPAPSNDRGSPSTPGFNRPSSGGSGSDIPWFERPSRPSKNKPPFNSGGSNPFPASPNGPFGSSPGGGGGDLDPLDIDFGDSLDPDNANLGGPSSSGSKENKPSSSSPGNSNTGPFSNGGRRPANPFSPGKPGGPFGGSAGGSDPLDDEFGSSLDSGTENLDNSTPSFGKPSDCDPVLGCEDDDLGNLDIGSNSGGSKSSSKEPPGNWGNVEKPSSEKPTNLGSRPGSNKPSSTNRPGGVWDRNDFPSSSSDFDSWRSNELSPSSNQNSNNRPGSANWGGPQRPVTTTTPPPNAFDNSPWRPTGPWGSGFNDLNPPPPRPGPSSNIPTSPNGDSWWDPPVALPLRPHNPSITPPLALPPRPSDPRITAPPPPPPSVWANPYRTRYPVYQIVAYPTWPGPMDRRPIIVVYSNSRK